MSRKKRKPIVPVAGRHGPTTITPIVALQNAVQQLRRGHYGMVQDQVGRLLQSGLEPGLEAAARELLAEAHFRAALSSDDPGDQVRRLEAALRLTPDAPKLHFYHGLALWHAGSVPEALIELDAAAAREPGRRGLAYLRALARVASGKAWDPAGLTPAEANTLRLVGRLRRPDPFRVSGPVEEPLLGRGPELWQALVAMHEDPAAAPAAQLKAATDQNTRRPIARILHYYRGVAAMRAGDRRAASNSWVHARSLGFGGAALAENLIALERGEAVELAEEGQWQAVADLAERLHGSRDAGSAAPDRIMAETASLAYFHLGYEAAQAGKWTLAAQHWRKANDLNGARFLAQNLALAEEALGNWNNAAEAWRDLVRRRPRKEDHPDYLTDVQVAAIWNHAAACYQRAQQPDQVETCLRNALKYAADDTALRLQLADTLLAKNRGDAAETQLKEIIALEPAHLEALERLGRLYESWWDRDPMPIWRQVLAINPAHAEARDALADGYYALVTDASLPAFHHLRAAHPGKNQVEILEIGLHELPGHPRLLEALGIVHARLNHPQQAREYLMSAYRAAPRDVRTAGSVLHELLHASAGDTVKDLVPQVRLIPHLLPAFWFDQASMALECKLGEEWAALFVEEGLNLAAQPWVEDTRAGLLVEAYELAAAQQASVLAAALEKRIREEVPASGAVQYLEAYRLNFEANDPGGARKLIREAIRAARRADDKGVLKRAEAIEQQLRGLPRLSEMDRFLEEMLRHSR